MGFTLSKADKDLDFQHIFQGMRRLRPVCDSLVSASTANDAPHMRDVDEAVVQMIRDWGRKLRDSIAHHPAGAPPPGAPAVVPGHLIVHPTLRPWGAPAHWDPAMPGSVVPAPPKRDIPNPVVPDPIVPDPDVQDPALPDPDVPDPDVPHPDVEDPVIVPLLEPVVPDLQAIIRALPLNRLALNPIPTA